MNVELINILMDMTNILGKIYSDKPEDYTKIIFNKTYYRRRKSENFQIRIIITRKKLFYLWLESSLYQTDNFGFDQLIGRYNYSYFIKDLYGVTYNNELENGHKSLNPPDLIKDLKLKLIELV